MSDEYLGCGNHSCRIEKPKGMGTNAGCSCLEGVPFERRSKILRAFDHLRKRAERAELERDTATRTVENIEGKVAMYDGKRRVAEAALEKVEVMLMALAKECAEFQKVIDCDAKNSEHDFRYWLEWAKQEAAKREGGGKA